MKKWIPRLAVSLIVLIPSFTTANVLESFTITTQNVYVREFTESSIQLKSDTNSYFIKIEPHRTGKVIFSLSGIGYASTAKFSNLRFGVKITGYRHEEVVYPTYSFDDVNKDILIEEHMLIFERIHGSIPVWFNEQIDSINLEFSNSLGVNISQYLGIKDLKIVPVIDISANPQVLPCQQNHVMIGIDGSSSIDKNERTLIGDHLLEFVRKSSFTQDSHQLCIVEFGSDIVSVVESTDKRVLIEAFQKYKRDKNDKSKFTSWTNWSVAFDEAIARKPDVFIFITDGWSNWSDNRSSSFSAQYESLLSKSNQLKANGTRLLFVTSDIDLQSNSTTILYEFLNGGQSQELQDDMLSNDAKLSDVDLITMKGFSKMSEINFSSILECQQEDRDIANNEDHCDTTIEILEINPGN